MNWLETAETVELERGTDVRQLVPFYKNEMQGYLDRYGCKAGEMTYIRFQGFNATMTFSKVTKGRSSVKFHFTDEYGTKYEMFMKDFGPFAMNSITGSLKGRWGFVKRGANYGIQLIGQVIGN